MDPRRFDDLTRSLTSPQRAINRRRLLAGLPALAAILAAPSIGRAFDGGGFAITPAPGQITCIGAIDCPSGLICLNGICSQLPVGGEQAAETPTSTTGGAPTPTPRGVTKPTANTTPGATISTTAEPTSEPAPTATGTPPAGVGGLTVPETPLPAGIYEGVCGSLGDAAAFPLIDIGVERGATGAPPAAPAGAPNLDTADFSTTVVASTLADLTTTPHAIDVRLDPRDPATSIACGNITGEPETTDDRTELPIDLQEQHDSGASGVAWIREEGTRSLAYVFLSRPQGAAAAGTPTPSSSVRKGDTVMTLSDVNLRAEPSTDAPVVEILGSGVMLDVTNDPTNGWIPVAEPVSGARGFVSEETVELTA